MKRLIQIFSIILFLALYIVPSNAQKSSASKKANDMYEGLGYGFSIEMYQNELRKGNKDPKLMARLANSYRVNGEYKEAERWYAEVVYKLKEPINYLHYAQMLQINERYDEAKVWFLRYDEAMRKGGKSGAKADKRGERLAAGCSNAVDFKNAENIKIYNAGAVNSKKLDFSPVFYGDGIVFVSSRKTKGIYSRKDSWANENFMDLFYADINADGTLGEAKYFSRELNTKYHEGSATFNRAGDVIYFTRNNYNKGKRKDDSKGIMKLQIFKAQKFNGHWDNIELMPFNNSEQTISHPALSPDAKTLVFAAKFKDSKGGMDLYISELVKGKWSKPRNLGPEVNTAGDEIFPFIHDDGTLYFSSNGLEGLGGLDIYSAQLAKSESGRKGWLKVENLGKPFNTSKDDFGFAMNLPKTLGYLSSNRSGGKGGDDIYTFSVPKSERFEMLQQANKNTRSLTICVSDMKTSSPIEGAEVSIIKTSEGNVIGNEEDYLLSLKPIEGRDNEFTLSLSTAKGGPDAMLKKLKTNSSGLFSHGFQDAQRYVMTIEKVGYGKFRQEYTVKELVDLQNSGACIPLEQRNCVALEGTTLNQQYNRAIPQVSVTLLNKCTGEISTKKSDQYGKFSFCLECGCDYKLMGDKDYFNPASAWVSTTNNNCGMPIYTDLLFMPSENNNNNPPMASGNNNGGNGRNNGGNTINNYYGPANGGNNPSNGGYNGGGAYTSNTRPRTSTPPPPPNDFREYSKSIKPKDVGSLYRPTYSTGMVIELDKIYYDFNKSFIRADARDELNKLVILMKRYPSMEIELSSHTDSRGDIHYNQKLSQARANKAIKYIISQGIMASRLNARGYGESQPRNNCVDGRPCSETQHQMNRRTEVKITRFNNAENIPVKYNDTRPEWIDKRN